MWLGRNGSRTRSGPRLYRTRQRTSARVEELARSTARSALGPDAWRAARRRRRRRCGVNVVRPADHAWPRNFTSLQPHRPGAGKKPLEVESGADARGAEDSCCTRITGSSYMPLCLQGAQARMPALPDRRYLCYDPSQPKKSARIQWSRSGKQMRDRLMVQRFTTSLAGRAMSNHRPLRRRLHHREGWKRADA